MKARYQHIHYNGNIHAMNLLVPHHSLPWVMGNNAFDSTHYTYC